MKGHPTRALLHPLAVALLPIPAMIAVLLADGISYGLLCIAVCLVAAWFRGPRFAAGITVVTVAVVAMIWFGFAFSLPDDPLGRESSIIEWLPLQLSEDRLFVALRGALRIASLVTLFVVPLAFVRWAVLADTLIERYGVPYRLVDVSGLGGRFKTLIDRDVTSSRTLVKLRTRGSPLVSLRLLAKISVPVLMASFRHADELAVAMDARGFGAHTLRTVHHSSAVKARDLVVLSGAWAVTILAAVLLA